jgi:signal transduction histidine kinase
MDSDSGISLSGPRPAGWRLAVLGLVALVAALMLGVSWAALPGADGDVGRTAADAYWTAGRAIAALALVAASFGLWRVEQQQARERGETRELRERLQCLNGLLDVWHWRTDAGHRLVELLPPAGSPADEWALPLPTTPIWELFSAGDADALRGRATTGVPFDDLAVHRADRRGDLHGFLLRGRPRSDANGRFDGYQGVLLDARPRPVDASNSNETAGASTRRAAASTSASAADPASSADGDHESFSFTVSHDLRAPIRVVEGFTKIVKEDYGRLLDRVGNDHLDRVLGAAARMNNMIDALLALSRLSSQPLQRQPVNLSQLAGYVVDDLRRQYPDRAVTVEIEPALLVQGDPTLLRMVIDNLLGNAWKYSAKTEHARITLGRQPKSADTYCVTDNGAGFDMRFADRLFGVFQRLHSANDFAGTGIGLASVRRIVRRHGGDVWGEGEVGRGARFHFTLPQAGGQTITPARD